MSKSDHSQWKNSQTFQLFQTNFHFEGNQLGQTRQVPDNRVDHIFAVVDHP